MGCITSKESTSPTTTVVEVQGKDSEKEHGDEKKKKKNGIESNSNEVTVMKIGSTAGSEKTEDVLLHNNNNKQNEVEEIPALKITECSDEIIKLEPPRKASVTAWGGETEKIDLSLPDVHSP